MGETLFDTREGTLVSNPEVIEAIGAEDARLLSLSALLTMPDFPFRRGDFQPEPPSAWTRERCIEFGGWVMNVLKETPEPLAKTTAEYKPKLIRDHMERLHILGLGPSRHTLRNHFRTMAGYGEAAEIRTGKNSLYDDWPLANYVSYANRLARQLRRKPREPDYEHLYLLGKGPSLYQMLHKVGGVRKLNEHIGYPNVHDWLKDDYTAWGVKVAQANEGGVLTARLLTHLSKKKRGPSVSIIGEKFDNLAVFQSSVAAEKTTLEMEVRNNNQEILKEYDKIAAEGLGLSDPANTTENDKILYTARYLVAAKCLPQTEASRLARFAQMPTHAFITTLQQARIGLKTALIELTAVQLSVFDNLWPMDEWRYYLHVPVAELGYIRSGNQARFTGSIE